MSGQDQRGAPRYHLESVRAEMNGAEVGVVDVSPTGLLLAAVAGDLKRGDAITVRLSVPLLKRLVPVDIDGFVVRCEDRGIAIDYVRPAITWPRVLRLLDAKQQASA